MKKFISLFLVFAMLFAIMPSGAAAASAGTGATGSTGVTRYTVLILDTSGSMYGTPMTVEKAAAVKFCTSVLKADGKNYVSLIKLNTSPYVDCDFTDDLTLLTNKINKLGASGGTDINAALKQAKDKLSNINGSNDINNNIIKNIVLLSDGLPERGNVSKEGPYTASDHSSCWRYANCAYSTAADLKTSNFIYTLGFFHSLSGDNLNFGRRFMQDIQNAGYFDVTDVDKLEFAFDDIADDITNGSGSCTFTYASGESNDYTGKYYYSDDYFTQDPSYYHNSLATMSLCLALSAFGSNKDGTSDYSDKSRNVKNLLCDELGFDKNTFETNNWFTVKPTSDSIGAAIAQKKIKDGDEDCTLIALAVRGGGYESEWASNFTLGISGQASGFSSAKSQALKFLKDYISNEKNGVSGRIKLWITGYSRAAATSNLVAAAIDDDLSMFGSNVSLKRGDMFAYCFETPMGALKSDIKSVLLYDASSNASRYSNIWNIVNKNDPVTKVAMSDLDFARYGNDHYLPDRLTSEYFSKWQPLMLRFFNSMDSFSETGAYNVDDFRMKKLDFKYIIPGGNSLVQNDVKNKLTQGGFLDEAITKLTIEQIKTRENYVYEFQNGIRVICTTRYGTLLNGYSEESASKFYDLFISKITDSKTLGKLLCRAVMKPSDLEAYIKGIVSECLNECGMNDVSISSFTGFVSAIAKLVAAFAATHPNLTATLISNISSMGAAHYPELCMAWLMAEDSNYTSEPIKSSGTGSYRTLRINCPVDIQVYDASGSLVAAIKNDTPQAVQGSSIVSSINEDGEKIVALPVTAEYSVKMTATDDGTVNYSVSEFSGKENDNNRIINYFNIKVGKGDILTGTLPAYTDSEIKSGAPDGSSARYTLRNAQNDCILADSDLSGDDAVNAYYMVNAASGNTECGLVTGSGIRQLGNFAQLEAFPAEGCSFTGWYRNNELLSTESVYRFAVTEDADITGIFVKDADNTSDASAGHRPKYTVSFETNGGSSVSSQTVSKNTMIAAPSDPIKADNVFAGWYTDSSLAEIYDFSSPVTCNMTLYAKWIPVLPEVSENNRIILTVGKKEVILFGEKIYIDVAPKIVKNRTMLPVRFVSESLGCNVEWDAAKRTVTVTNADTEIKLTIGSYRAIVNGRSVMLDSPAFIENNRTYLPLRFISENLGAPVEWNAADRTVTITKVKPDDK